MVYDARYVQGRGVPCVRTDIRVCRTSVAPENDEVEKTSGIHMRTSTDVFSPPVRCSRARYFVDPPTDTIVEKCSGADQPNPSRNSRPPSRLLGSILYRFEFDCANPRVSGLETGIHVATIFVDHSQLRKTRGPNPRVPRTLKILPHRPVTMQKQIPTSPQCLLPINSPCHWTTQGPIRPGSAGRCAKHLRSSVAPCSYSWRYVDNWE